jgi:hypothetical protein
MISSTCRDCVGALSARHLYCVDRWLFRYVMTFMRDGTLPEDRALLSQLYREAVFWNLSSLQRAIEEERVRRSLGCIYTSPSLPEHRTWGLILYPAAAPAVCAEQSGSQEGHLLVAEITQVNSAFPRSVAGLLALIVNSKWSLQLVAGRGRGEREREGGGGCQEAQGGLVSCCIRHSALPKQCLLT